MRCLIIAAALLLASPVAAHDFYHPGCCHELKMEHGHMQGDCGPADVIKQLPEGTLFRQRVTGIEVVVPIDFKRRYPNEHDNLYHICVTEDREFGSGVQLYCLYEPQGS